MYEKAIQHLNKDPKLKKIIGQTMLPELSPMVSVFYSLLQSICSQQLSTKAATTIFGRFLELFPQQIPTPDLVSAMDFETLRSVGLSKQKASYIQNIAQFWKENEVERIDWGKMDDEEIVDFLSQIKGVGVWTVQMLLMFTLDRPDVLPVLDLGIQQGFQKLFGLETKGKELKTDMHRLSEPWRPYRTLACRYLWAYKDGV